VISYSFQFISHSEVGDRCTQRVGTVGEQSDCGIAQLTQHPADEIGDVVVVDVEPARKIVLMRSAYRTAIALSFTEGINFRRRDAVSGAKPAASVCLALANVASGHTRKD
jgi:hypothetical protein